MTVIIFILNLNASPDPCLYLKAILLKQSQLLH
jgi:hypothetical protein